MRKTAQLPHRKETSYAATVLLDDLCLLHCVFLRNLFG